jgi:U3 small nucleolar RNA-associated protein 3
VSHTFHNCEGGRLVRLIFYRDANDALLEDDQYAAVPHSISKIPVEPLDRATAIRHLEKTSPETIALAREWDDVARDLMRAKQRLKQYV